MNEENKTSSVVLIESDTGHSLSVDRLRSAASNVREELGYRRPHVRAAMDLAELLADDPNLTSNPGNALRAYALASTILVGTARRFSRTVSDSVETYEARELLVRATQAAGVRRRIC